MTWFTPSMVLESYQEASNKVNEMMKENNTYEKREVVAEWHVPLDGRIYKIEFEHGTTTGKRVIWIDEKEILRRDWMFKLVGDDFFHLNDTRCIINVDPAPGFRYTYDLFVDGKPYKQFTERQAKVLKSWEIKTNNDKQYLVVLEKHSLNIWVNGKLIEEQGEFVENGTDTEFILDDNKFVLKARASEIPRQGILHTLYVNDELLNESGVAANVN